MCVCVLIFVLGPHIIYKCVFGLFVFCGKSDCVSVTPPESLTTKLSGKQLAYCYLPCHDPTFSFTDVL